MFVSVTPTLVYLPGNEYPGFEEACQVGIPFGEAIHPLPPVKSKIDGSGTRGNPLSSGARTHHEALWPW
jgi:hypothetical protein